MTDTDVVERDTVIDSGMVDTRGIHGGAVPAITAAQMRDKLKTLDELREILSASEPIESVGFATGTDQVRFVLDGDWASNEATEGTDTVHATVSVGPVGNSTEYRLTKDALLEATSICGLPKKYTERTPANLIEPQLNYWFRTGLGSKPYQVLVTGADRTASAVVKGSISPFSNLQLLDRALEGIDAKYGKGISAADGGVLVDYKLQHSLRRTKFNLIVPEQTRVMERTGTEDDTWSAGLSVVNSLIGLEQTSLAGYLFRWWCTNGAIDTSAAAGTWSRKAGQGTEVYEWAQQTVDEILGGLEHSFDKVQSLVDVPLDGAVADVLRDIFSEYAIPANERQRVIENMVDSDQINMYGVMQAVTMVANRPDIDPGHMQDLMRVGGDLPHTVGDRCVACHRIRKG